MKISWISDFVGGGRGGGAQITDRIMIDEGKERGHQIDTLGLFNINNLGDALEYVLRYEQIIVSNYAELIRLPKGKLLLSVLVSAGKYIRYVHDYDNHKVKDDLKEKIMINASKVIYLSPLHKKTHNEIFGINEGICIPSPIDVEVFTDWKIRRSGYLLLGEIAKHKGLRNNIEYLQKRDKVADWYTWNVDRERVFENVTFFPALPYELMPYLFNTYEHFIHLPEWKEPFGRTVAEAYLSGINLTTNGNCGFSSYEWEMDEAIQNMKEAPQTFWNFIEKL